VISTKGRPLTTSRVYLPDLGQRGEGWVVLQFLLFAAIIGAGVLGPLWSGPARVAGAIVGLALIIFGVGLVTAALGWSLVMASPLALAGAVVLGVFFDLKSRREETWLAEQFAGYAAYRRRTRRLIPWLY
jgi:hypothetical protein